MIDVKLYEQLYKDKFAGLTSEETLQLVLEAETEEEKDFFEMVGNFLLQRDQRKVIEEHVY